MFSPGALAGLERDRAELRQHVVRLRVGDPGDVADGEHLGMARDAEIGLGSDAVRPLELEPERVGERVRLQPCAPDERVGLEHLAGLERDPRRLDRLTISPSRTSTPRSSSAFFVYVRSFSLNIRRAAARPRRA